MAWLGDSDSELDDFDFDFADYGCRSLGVQADWRKQNAEDLLTAKQLSALPAQLSTVYSLCRLAKRNGYNILRDALQQGLTNVATAMLNNGAHVNNVSGKASDSPLHHAVLGNHTEIISQLLLKGAKVHAENKQQKNSLFLAVEIKSVDAIRLLANRANVNDKNKQGKTLLHCLVLSSYSNALNDTTKEIAKLLVSLGADVNAKTGTNETLLQVAINRRHDKVVKFLIQLKADVNMCGNGLRTPLRQVVDKGNTDLIVFLLTNGAHVNAWSESDKCTALQSAVRADCENIVQLLLNWPDIKVDSQAGNGETALHMAAQKGYGYIVKALLEKGATVNAKDDGGKSALHHTAEAVYPYLTRDSEKVNKSISPLHLLLDNGADVNLRDNVGRTPVHYAVLKSKGDIVLPLLKNGANVNLQDIEGQTPLHRAFNRYHNVLHGKPTGTISMLLEHGAETNVSDKTGKTPLHVAVLAIKDKFNSYQSNTDIDLLFKHGAEVNARDKNGKTPLHYAAECSILPALIEHGADINAVDNEGKTALHIATESGKEQNALALIKHGVHVDAQDNDGKTPLHYAAKTDIATTLLLLLERGVNVNSKDIQGKTPLYEYVETGEEIGLTSVPVCSWSVPTEHYAPEKVEVQVSHSVIATILLEHGSVVDCRDKERGKTVLHVAAERGRVDLVKTLLKYEADVNIRADVFPHHTPLKCSAPATVATLENHILMLAALSFPVHEMDLQAIHLNSPRVQKFQTQCEDEIKRSKERKVVNGDKIISFYDILTKNKQKMTFFLKNGVPSHISDLMRFQLNDFPIFRNMIANHFRLTVERVSLLQEITLFLGDLYSIPPGICVDAITDYLTNGNLKSFITACRSNNE